MSLHRPAFRIVAVCVVFLATLAAVPPVAARPPDPKVVVIVGPVGDLTDRYREFGRVAEREARRWTSNVVAVVSPNATWPAVRSALQGASIVVYLGHGNGFPSPYRSEPSPRTQNGLGLNPVAGVDDIAHQYFGESFLAADVRLATGAVVLLSHLCYASGNPEPGGPNPTIEIAGERADNYAAGWLAAGAAAVVADAFAPLDEYVGRLFRSNRSIERLWSTASTRHGHVIGLPSRRTPGASVRLDPTKPAAGFYRSLVWLPGHAAGPRTNVPARAASGRDAPLVTPSLIALGIRPGAPTLAPAGPGAGFIASGQSRLEVPLSVPTDMNAPPDLRIGVRWQPLDPVPLPSATAGTGPSAAPGGSGPPAIALVAVEEPAAEVASLPARRSGEGLSVAVTLPERPGRYRLTTTIHDASDVAFDAATQAPVTHLIVTVSPPVAVAYGVRDTLVVTGGDPIELPVRLGNPGAEAWSAAPITFDAVSGTGRHNPGPVLVARWVRLDAATWPSPVVTMPAPRLAPGDETVVVIGLTTPRLAGDYLLLIDLVTPDHGSLAASGSAMGEIAVTVEPLPRLTGTDAGS